MHNKSGAARCESFQEAKDKMQKFRDFSREEAERLRFCLRGHVCFCCFLFTGCLVSRNEKGEADLYYSDPNLWQYIDDNTSGVISREERSEQRFLGH